MASLSIGVRPQPFQGCPPVSPCRGSAGAGTASDAPNPAGSRRLRTPGPFYDRRVCAPPPCRVKSRAPGTRRGPGRDELPSVSGKGGRDRPRGTDGSGAVNRRCPRACPELLPTGCRAEASLRPPSAWGPQAGAESKAAEKAAQRSGGRSGLEMGPGRYHQGAGR